MSEEEREPEQQPFTVLVIPTNIFEPCRLELISAPWLTPMQGLVGGYIELVNVDWGRLTDPNLTDGVHIARRATLVVNENFRYLDVPVNFRASLLYPWHGGILGQAFVCGPPTWNGLDTDVPKEVSRYFLP